MTLPPPPLAGVTLRRWTDFLDRLAPQPPFAPARLRLPPGLDIAPGAELWLTGPAPEQPTWAHPAWRVRVLELHEVARDPEGQPQQTVLAQPLDVADLLNLPPSPEVLVNLNPLPPLRQTREAQQPHRRAFRTHWADTVLLGNRLLGDGTLERAEPGSPWTIRVVFQGAQFRAGGQPLTADVAGHVLKTTGAPAHPPTPAQVRQEARVARAAAGVGLLGRVSAGLLMWPLLWFGVRGIVAAFALTRFLRGLQDDDPLNDNVIGGHRLGAGGAVRVGRPGAAGAGRSAGPGGFCAHLAAGQGQGKVSGPYLTGMVSAPDRDRLLIVTPHSSGQLPADVLRDMLGEDALDTNRRAALLERVFMDGDPYTDLLYAVPGARLVSAPWSRFAVDLNRERGDRVDNGVIKLTTFDRLPLYPPGFVLGEAAREARLRRLWDSFDALVQSELRGAALMIVGHCMAPTGPQLGLDTGTPRPGLCLMLGTEAEPTFPHTHWAALHAACQDAFGPFLKTTAYPQVKIGVPWDTDTLSLTHSRRSGVPAFGIEFNSALYLPQGPGRGTIPDDQAVRALAAASTHFADAALALVGG